jgi:DNA repair exonuclease SbcCD ATPase subunit
MREYNAIWQKQLDELKIADPAHEAFHALVLASELIDKVQPKRLQDLPEAPDDFQWKALAYIAKIGRQLYSLYKTSDPLLERRSLSLVEKIQETEEATAHCKQKLEETEQLIKKLDTELPQKRSLEQKLLDKEETFKRQQNEYQTRETNIARLQKIEFDNLPEKLDQIEQEQKALQKKVDELVARRHKLEGLLESVNAARNSEEKDTKTVLETLLANLDKYREDYERLEREQHKKVALFREVVETLLEMEQDNQQILAHLKENQYVLENMRNAGFAQLGDAPQKADALEQQAQEALRGYDQFLKALLADAKAAQDKLKIAQGK